MSRKKKTPNKKIVALHLSTTKKKSYCYLFLRKISEIVIWKTAKDNTKKKPREMKMESMAHTKDCYYRLLWNFFHFFFVLFSEIVLETLTTLNVGLLLV